MLLAQVCALHDPTPRTFTVHVLELFERGILDHQSIRFLYDLGLVPQSSSPTSASSSANTNERMVPQWRAGDDRSKQASDIRSRLQNTQHSSPSSWSVDEHPLSLSRYVREFEQTGLLSAGSFGEVFSAKNKLDHLHYAVKRIPFDASGYSKESLSQVLREVHCLALCDHPHVVRYYTSWLEPSWMTGSSTSSSSFNNPNNRKLLTGIEQLVEDGSSAGLSDDLKDYFKDPIAPGTIRRRSSFDSTSKNDQDVSEWSMDNERSAWTVDAKDDEFVDGYPTHRLKVATKSSYKYQICLFIQMQLCHPATLADWIQKANERRTCFEDRIEPAIEIFHQIASGLSHVHGKLVHRDLKPANIFTDIDGKTFKIGDFGLSKLILNPSTSSRSSPTRHGQQLLPYDRADDHFGGPMTAGIGTASYAAPEQVSSKQYGPAADIFSLGLILLEMLCPISTGHERMQTFHDCRHRRDLPNCFKDHPLLAQTILACTAPNSKDRPSAAELLKLKSKLFPKSHEQTLAQESIEDLRRQLAQANLELANCRAELQQKEETIQELRQEQSKTTLDPTGQIVEIPHNATMNKDSHTERASSSSSEEGI